MAAILNSAILNSAILDSASALWNSDILFSSLRFTQKHSHSTLALTQLIQSDSNSFILTQLNDGGHLEFVHLGFRNLSFSSQTHSHLPRLVPTICTKILHSFILTDLDDGSYLEFCHVWFRPWHVCIQTPCYLLSVTLKNTLPPLWFWLKLIQSDSNSFILT